MPHHSSSILQFPLHSASLRSHERPLSQKPTLFPVTDLTMSFVKSMQSSFPLPSFRNLENSHYELQHGEHTDFEEVLPEHNPRESTEIEGKREEKTTWIARLFARSPRAIIEKREALMPNSQRTSIDDLESQLSSTDASTLYDEKITESESSSGNKTRSRIDPRTVSDAIIGLSDGLTVPFALTAGLSALGSTNVVIYAGLAELTAGAISMGLGGYLGAKSEEESSAATRETAATALATTPSTTITTATAEIFAPYDLPAPLLADLSAHLTKLSPEQQLSFLVAFEHQLPDAAAASRAVICAATIAAGYFLGGFIPLLPYFFVGKDEVLRALWWSLGVMAASLFAFGYGKTCFVSGWGGRKNVLAGCRGGLQMVVVGGLAAGCAMGLVRLFHGLAV